MKVLIVEDEEVAYRNLKSMILNYDSGIQILGWFKSIRKTLEWLRSNALPDLIFLDIKLADGLSFEIFEQIEVNIPVIFTTAYHEYALKAFKVNSVDYLLKPFSPKDLEISIEKLKKIHFSESKMFSKKIEEVMDSMMLLKAHHKNRFMVKSGGKIKSLPTDEIAYFYREDLVMLVNNSGHRFVINYSLEELERLLDPVSFFRINRKFLVHIQSVEEVRGYFKGKLKVDLKPKPVVDVVVSQEKASTFKRWMDGN